jgi:hypothetical protein
MLELPTRSESSMTVGSRVSRKFGNTSYKFLPSTELSECRLTRAIQSFQATMRLCASRTTIPTSNASKACLVASFDTSPNIASGPPSSALEGVANDFLKHGDRRQMPGQRNQAADIARPVHTDGKNGDQAPLRKLRPRRQPPTTVLSTDRSGCHRRRYKSRVRRRNRGQVLRIESAAIAAAFRRRPQAFRKQHSSTTRAPARAEKLKDSSSASDCPNACCTRGRSRLAPISRRQSPPRIRLFTSGM